MTNFYGNSNPGAGASSVDASGFSPRDRFWSPGGNNGNGRNSTTPDPWAQQGQSAYTPQIGTADLSAYSPSGSSPSNGTYGHTPMPLPSPYGNQQQQQQRMLGNANGDMSFAGPTPPNQLQPVPSPYGSSAATNNNNGHQSPRRQYTPSTTPSPLITHQSPQQNANINGTPVNAPPAVNGINGSSNGGTNSPSINGCYDNYMNGDHAATSDGSNGSRSRAKLLP